MAKYTVVTMPGDGIGNQVLPESLRVLKAVGFDAEYIHADIGWECWRNEGNALPQCTIDLLAKHKLGLFGAITSKPNKEAQAELKPELRSKGHVYYSPIVTMRQKFNLDICMRPCIGFSGNPLNYIRKRVDGSCDEPQIDTTVFRQNTEGMYAGVEETAKEVAKNYPGIALWSTNIDAQLMWLNKNPEDYNVIVASNLFGDILSDAFAGPVGGLGFAASGNIGDDVAGFEPTHGSAPKYAELAPPIVNAIAMILSAAMMLDHIGEGAKAERIRKAIADVVREGKVRTYDMMRIPGGTKAIAQGAASTVQMTDAILEKLK